MLNIRDCVRSLLPGRVRLRHPMLKGVDADTITALSDMLMGISGVKTVEVNARVGSILLTWDEEVISAQTLLETVEGYAEFFSSMIADTGEASAEEVSTKEGECSALVLANNLCSKVETAGTAFFGEAAQRVMPTLSQRNPKRAARVLQNRTMLCALALSLLALGTKSVKMHLWAGVAFAALLGLHLEQHRRVL